MKTHTTYPERTMPTDPSLLIARQREEADTWGRISQELFLECDRLFTESTGQRRDYDKRVATLEEQLRGAVEDLAQAKSKLTYREAQLAKVQRSFLFTFFSLRFTAKQIVKLLLHRAHLRQAPDPTDYLAGDITS
jgi:hypothetical protein